MSYRAIEGNAIDTIRLIQLLLERLRLLPCGLTQSTSHRYDSPYALCYPHLHSTRLMYGVHTYHRHDNRKLQSEKT